MKCVKPMSLCSKEPYVVVVIVYQTLSDRSTQDFIDPLESRKSCGSFLQVKLILDFKHHQNYIPQSKEYFKIMLHRVCWRNQFDADENFVINPQCPLSKYFYRPTAVIILRFRISVKSWYVQALFIVYKSTQFCVSSG